VLDLPAWFEIGSLVVLTLILVADLLLVVKRPHVPSFRESTLWVVFYVSLALIFALLMLLLGDTDHAVEFVVGWLTEYSLSIDNLFVFVVIMARFSVPKKMQQEVLMVGIILALIFRGVFILLGAQLIANFSWIFYIFGAWLVWTAIQQAFLHREENAEENESKLIRVLRRRVRISDDFDGIKLRTTINGTRMFTPILIVFIAIGTTDLLFALDSIPAIFGITQSPFIVFTANVFALMGLRQLYFLLGGLLERLEYLKYRREARAARPARERAPVHQRRRARRLGARDHHVDLARRDRRRDGGRHDREPREGSRRREAPRSHAPRRGAALHRGRAAARALSHRTGTPPHHSVPRRPPGIASVGRRRPCGAGAGRPGGEWRRGEPCRLMARGSSRFRAAPP
jgi:tellurite resistance protein TerC